MAVFRKRAKLPAWGTRSHLKTQTGTETLAACERHVRLLCTDSHCFSRTSTDSHHLNPTFISNCVLILSSASCNEFRNKPSYTLRFHTSPHISRHVRTAKVLIKTLPQFLCYAHFTLGTQTRLTGPHHIPDYSCFSIKPCNE
jgi:hypothetical protein